MDHTLNWWSRLNYKLIQLRNYSSCLFRTFIMMHWCTDILPVFYVDGTLCTSPPVLADCMNVEEYSRTHLCLEHPTSLPLSSLSFAQGRLGLTWVRVDSVADPVWMRRIDMSFEASQTTPAANLHIRSIWNWHASEWAALKWPVVIIVPVQQAFFLSRHYELYDRRCY